MKKILPILLLYFCFSATAQNFAPNFVVEDINGEIHDLYEYLGQNKFVVVEFMGTWCGPCQAIAPDVGQGFIDFGCNYNDVVFILIDTGSDTQACIEFEEEFMPDVNGLPMIMVSGTDGDGDDAHNTYGITGVPTILTISPLDTTYTVTDLGFYGVLAAAGIGQIESSEFCQLDYIVTYNIEGCTDDTALNYNAEAVIDDGSCLYDIILQELEDVVSNEYPDVYTYFSYLIDSLSDQIQNLQESLISETIEEEVVSDANSFDILNPLSYNGDFEVLHYDLTNAPLTIPSGKSFVISHINNDGFSNIFINGIKLMSVNSNGIGSPEEYLDLVIPIIVGENNEISYNDYYGNTNQSSRIILSGILVDHNYESVTTNLAYEPYVVPQNKTLIVTNIKGNVNLLLNGGILGHVESGSIHNQINIPLYFANGSVLSGEVTQWPDDYGPIIHGILIDNLNYTYVTDYELIDALNDGMDSLSSMSEIVVFENDSISSENDILTEENQALMAIDYNYDSLQYVTEYLYSQVFDLQQELLVPNIDVDMAIGWNMIGFSCPEEKGATDALIDIVDEVLIMKDNNGSVYMPEFGFNGIGDLTPGYGYQLKVTGYILDFNICE